MRNLRVFRGSVALAVGALLLVSCSSGRHAKVALPYQTITMPKTTAAVAAPGEQLKYGDVAALPITNASGTPDDQIETAVLATVKGNTDFWKKFKNGSKFSSMVPWFVMVQYRWVTGEWQNVSSFAIFAPDPATDPFYAAPVVWME
jgi:hypothetical protein